MTAPALRPIADGRTDYPGPLATDPPGWQWRESPARRGALAVTLRCAGCGRYLGPRTSCIFLNLFAPLGRMSIVGWHDACAEREPLKAAMYWPRERDGAWGEMLREVAKRGPGRIGPGNAHARACREVSGE